MTEVYSLAERSTRILEASIKTRNACWQFTIEILDPVIRTVATMGVADFSCLTLSSLFLGIMTRGIVAFNMLSNDNVRLRLLFLIPTTDPFSVSWPCKCHIYVIYQVRYKPSNVTATGARIHMETAIPINLLTGRGHFHTIAGSVSFYLKFRATA